MDRLADPFVALDMPPLDGHEFSRLQQRAWAGAANEAQAFASTAPVVARLQGFDLDDRPLLAGLTACPGELVTARTAVPLGRGMLGQQVVVLFEQGDPRLPIVMGVLGHKLRDEQVKTVGVAASEVASEANGEVAVLADGVRQVIEAERELVLRCGEASITLTRAGKVIIEGNYILSRSRGHNKMKGAAIDIN